MKFKEYTQVKEIASMSREELREAITVEEEAVERLKQEWQRRVALLRQYRAYAGVSKCDEPEPQIDEPRKQYIPEELYRVGR